MIIVEHLTKKFKNVNAVDDISFHVRRGDIYGFIGPNGAGKTTTMRILTTLLMPTGGEAYVDGWSVIDYPGKVRQLLGFMPDAFGLYPRITIEEYLDFYAHAYRIPPKRRKTLVEGIMELTDLTELSDRFADELSKGMRQRLCLAKTLIHEPSLLILDEPASGLDPRARIEIRSLLKKLRDLGKTIFISSHILTELSDICNAVGIIEQGRLVVSGSVDSILEQVSPTHMLIVECLGELEKARIALGDCPLVEQVTIQQNKIQVQYSGKPEEIHLIVKTLTDAAVPFLSVSPEKEGLEQLFMKITHGKLA